MITRYIDFNIDNKYLTEVLPMIPTNTILNKTLTGLGATYGELKAERHSIIIEPNVPVIIGKTKDPKHKNSFGVYEGVYADDIVTYLEKNKGYHKILTTPESFCKIKNAFLEVEIDMYEECFLLFDECERIIQDVCYRQDIALPIDDFFKFKNKAMVSATPIIPKDPRFKEQGFQLLQIRPTYNYKQDLQLVSTNNILKTLRDDSNCFIKNSDDDKPLCIFINSTDTIQALIQQLGIEKDSAVFCSTKSVHKLKDKKFNHAYDLWTEKRMKKYNFFTSRFYSAVDIILPYKVSLMIVSDIFYAEHSMIDPYTEAPQIIGRFRNGVEEVAHITNYNYNIAIRKEEEINSYLQCSEEIYAKIKNLYDTTLLSTYKQAYKEALAVIPYSRFINNDGTKNYFALDNYKEEEVIKSYYNNPTLLEEAYIQSNRYNIQTFNHEYPLSDEDRLQQYRYRNSPKKMNAETLRQLILLSEDQNDYQSSIIQEYRNELYHYNPLIVEAFELLGADKIRELRYSRPKLKEAILLKQHNEKTSGVVFQQAIENSFKVNTAYTRVDIKDELRRLYKLFNIKPTEAITAETIRKYYNVKPAKIKQKQAFRLITRL